MNPTHRASGMAKMRPSLQRGLSLAFGAEGRDRRMPKNAEGSFIERCFVSALLCQMAGNVNSHSP